MGEAKAPSLPSPKIKSASLPNPRPQAMMAAMAKKEIPARVCGGVPTVFLHGGETPSERLALQKICDEQVRQPSLAERLAARKRSRP